MNESTPDPAARPVGNHHTNARIILVLLVSILLGCLAATSPAWAIGIPVTLCALPGLSHLTGGPRDRED